MCVTNYLISSHGIRVPCPLIQRCTMGDLPRTYLPSHRLPHWTVYLLSLLATTTFLLQPPTASPILDWYLSVATPSNVILYYIVIFLLLSNNWLILAVVIWTCIHVQLSLIPAKDTRRALSGGPEPIPYHRAISTMSSLLLCFCTPVLLFVRMHACIYVCTKLCVLDVFFFRVSCSSSSTLSNSTMWLPH